MTKDEMEKHERKRKREKRLKKTGKCGCSKRTHGEYR
jgi:hypothetical protein